MAKQALGRGLGALMGGAPAGTQSAPAAPDPAPPEVTVAQEVSGEAVQRISIARLKPGPFQPRRDFAEDPLRELADSIREQGVLQPLVVRARNGGFEIIAGERRWRAAQLAGLSEVPVLVREADDAKAMELALIENLQRENLNPIEEALGFSKLIGDFQLTQEEAAAKVGKSRAVVANLLRLLQLHPEAQRYVRSNLLSVGHAKVILGCADGERQRIVAEQVIREHLSVRQTEDLVAAKPPAPAKAGANGHPAPAQPDVHVSAVQSRLQERFGTKVLVRYRKGKGSVEIRFFNDDDLDRILEIAGVRMD